MQVSQQEDHITHAVIGQQESVSMGMSDDAALMHILSATLYTHPKLASVREVICNGWDAHISSNKTDVALEITSANGMLKVRDFGTGIPHDKIGLIYGTYGKSTKRDDKTLTGGFGLGSKAPFAYTDNFEVVSHCEGVKTVYRVSKSSMERGGKPSINKIVAVPTTESGIEVSMAIKPEHENEFVSLVQEVLMLGGIRARVNRETPVEPLPLLESPTGYIITSFKGTNTNRINLRYGNVVYPIPRVDAYDLEWRKVNDAMGKLWSHANITFMAPPDSVSIAPSREALILTDAGIETIKQMLNKFQAQEPMQLNATVQQIQHGWINKAIAEAPPVKSVMELKKSLYLAPKILGQGVSHVTGPYAYNIRKALLNHTLNNVRENTSGERVFKKRLDHAIRHKTLGDPKFIKALRKALHSDEHRKGHHSYKDRMLGMVHKFVTQPIYAAFAANEKLDKERLFCTATRWEYGTGELTRLKVLSIHRKETALAFTQKKLLMVRSKTAATEFLINLRRQDKNSEGWVVYLCTNNETSQQLVQDTFEALGYEVHRSIPAKAERIIDPNAPVKVAGPRKASSKRKGYLSLAQSRWNGTYLLSTAREAKPLDEPLLAPIAWTILRNKNEQCKTFGYFSQDECDAIYKLWGAQIAVVTSTQASILEKKGVVNVTDYVMSHVDETLSARKDFPRYLAFGRHAQEDIYNDKKKVIRHLVKHDKLMKELGLRFALTAETEMLLTFFDEKSRRDELKSMPKCKALLDKVPVSPQYKELVKKLKASPWAKFLDLDQLGKSLGSVIPDSADSEIPYHLALKLLK